MQEYAKTYDDVKKPRVQVHSTLGPLLWEQPQSPCLHPLCEHWLKSSSPPWHLTSSVQIPPDPWRYAFRSGMSRSSCTGETQITTYYIGVGDIPVIVVHRSPPLAVKNISTYPPIGCSVIHQTNWDGHEFLKCENRARARLDTLTL